MRSTFSSIVSCVLFALVLGCCERAAVPTPPAASADTGVVPATPDAAEAPDVAAVADVAAEVAAPKVDDAEPFPLWPTVQRGTLANGLTWYVMPHRMPQGRALVWLALNAGSIQEDDDQRGLAHVVEHMAFEGTKRFPKSSIVDWFERIGMRFGPDVNAYTGFDQTVYQLEVPTDDPAHLKTALDVLRDWAHDIEIQPASLERERRVVLEEWRRGRGARERVSEQERGVVFEGTRYAERMPIGLPDTIEHASQATIERFYRDWYRPDLMAVIVVGDVDPTATKAAIEARFADLKNPEPLRPRPPGGVSAPGPTRVTVTTDPELSQSLVTIYDMLPHRSEATHGDFRRALADQLWMMILAERFDVLTRKPDSPFSAAGANIDSMTRDFDVLRRSAYAKPGLVDESLRSLFTEVVRLQRHGFSQGEIERARAQMQRFYEQYDLGFETEPSASFADEITRNFFEGEFMVGPAAEKNAALAVLPSIERADIEAVARTFEASGRRAVMISGGTDAKLPARERVLAIIGEVEAAAATIGPWEDATEVGELMATPPTPGSIVGEKVTEAIGVTEWKLSNGVRVIVKPTTFEVDAFDIVGDSPGGFATLSNKESVDLTYTESVLGVGGLGGLDAVSLGRWAAGKTASADSAIYATSERVSGSGAKRDLETVLELMHLRMTAPRRDDAAIALWKENNATELEASQRLPDSKVGREMLEALYQKHPLVRTLTPADIRAIDVDRAFAFHKERFGDASDFTFVVVGDVDLAVLKPLVEKWLASLPAAGRVEKERDRGLRLAPGVVKKTWRAGKEPKAIVTMWFHGEENWSRDAERDMSILQQVLDIRLREVLRQDLGGVYSVSVSGGIERAPHPSRQLSISFGCAPAQVDALIAATMGELKAVAKTGVSDEIIAKIGQAVLRDREVSLRNNGTWLNWLDRAAWFGDDATKILDPSGYQARITNEFIKAAAARYLDKKQVFTAIRLPE